jgi:hypothetical protein
MSTLIENLLQCKDEDTENFVITPENMSDALMDFSLDEEVRLKALSLYFETKGDDVVDVMRRLVSIYSMAPTKNLESFLGRSCKIENLPYDIRLESMLNLCCYKEDCTSFFSCLSDLTSDFDTKDVVYTKRIEAVLTLLRNKEFHTIAKELMSQFLNKSNLDPEYRYKTVLSMKTSYDLRKTWATKEQRLKLDEERLELEREFLLFLLRTNDYDPVFRILSGQFLLVNHSNLHEKDDVLRILLTIGENEKFFYNTRADATDVVLRYASDELLKKEAEELIIRLGKDGKDVEIMNIYENAQNAHTKDIENSALSILCKLNELPLQRQENGDVIDFAYVEARILSDLSERAKIAMNRIKLDNALYGNQKLTLKSCLVYVYSFIMTHEYRELLLSRLYDELTESAGICSTGIMERMANTFTGIVDELSIRISFEDAILGALHGRLNKKITDLYTQPCIHNSDKKFCTCLRNACPFGKMMVAGELKVELKRQKRDAPCGACTICSQKDHLEGILKERFLKIADIKCTHICTDNCNAEIVDLILEEMIIPTKFPEKRANFLRFFRKFSPDLFDELQKEYEEYIDGVSFDMYMKKAILKYEGEN